MTHLVDVLSVQNRLGFLVLPVFGTPPQHGHVVAVEDHKSPPWVRAAPESRSPTLTVWIRLPMRVRPRMGMTSRTMSTESLGGENAVVPERVETVAIWPTNVKLVVQFGSAEVVQAAGTRGRVAIVAAISVMR